MVHELLFEAYPVEQSFNSTALADLITFMSSIPKIGKSSP
jgi:hypothetical protein